MDLTIVLFALIGPFLVWPVEYFLPYPSFVEELFKAILIYFLPQKNYKTVVISGVAFALTETVLYAFNIFNFGGLELMLTRLLSTSILHSATFLTIYIFGKNGGWRLIIGLIIAVLIHYIYNTYIPIY
ncbi:MAG: PrsW family intramembrane metalloprotease [Candidatus Woesebacteria bacterium]|nr:MAG: PrsW family intramembrane metalloprotease [Candidatus Woesebacteria bacterium]